MPRQALPRPRGAGDDPAGKDRLAHAPADHPPVRRAKIGVLLANLGTPDNYDYWSMRRYLNEFLSDKRVIDYASWKWQPLLQLIILTKRPFTSGANYKLIWNHEQGRKPAADDHQGPDREDRGRAGRPCTAAR